MMPGVHSVLASRPLSAGHYVAIAVAGNPMAVGVGRLLFNPLERAPGEREGRVVEAIHSYGDQLWRLSGETRPNEGFLDDCVVPVGPVQLPTADTASAPPAPSPEPVPDPDPAEPEMDEAERAKKIRALSKKLKQLAELEAKVAEGGAEALNSEQQAKLATKDELLERLASLELPETNRKEPAAVAEVTPSAETADVEGAARGERAADDSEQNREERLAQLVALQVESGGDAAGASAALVAGKSAFLAYTPSKLSIYP